MGDTASWFYKTRIPEIQDEYNLTYSEALTMATKDKLLYKHTDHKTVEVDLRDDQILQLALQAHEKGITLNDHINKIIADSVEKIDDQPEKVQLLTEKKNDKVQKRKV